MYGEEKGFFNDINRAKDLQYHDYGNESWLSFQSIRKRHNENICHETNKLLLRLDRLINDAPQSYADGGEHGKAQMRDHERSVVDWTSDDIVKLCPFCAKSFTLSRRRHHCRLCGAVMCHNCSLFLDYEDACKLIRPTDLGAHQDGDTTRQSASNEQLNKIASSINPEVNTSSPTDKVKNKSFTESLFSPLMKSSSKLNDSVKNNDSRPFLLSNAFGILQSQNRRGSQTSLLTFINTVNNSSSQADPQISKIRLCEDCKRLLNKRIQSIEDHYYHPFFCDFYEKLRSRITSADELLVTYNKMCESLKIGEEDYKIQDAQELRSKLDTLKNNIAHMAKNITTLASDSNEKEIQLISAIRQSIGFWVKKYESLAAYPTEEEYENLKLQRRQQIEEQLSMGKSFVVHGNESSLMNRVDLDTTSPRREKHGFSGLSKLSNTRGGMKRSITMGDSFNANNSAWVPDQSMLDTEEANPLLIQIRNLEEYIKQARNASRYEEVSTLEANLRDLEIEFLIQQGDSVHLDDSTTSD